MSLTNKRILLTGANGFIGSNLAYALVKKKAKVVALTRSLKRKSPLITGKVKKWETGSVTNFSNLNRIVKKNNIDIIFHLAAQSEVEKGADNPSKTFQVNNEGTWNILEAARRSSVEKVIVASTTHVYGDNPNIPYKEKFYPRPTRPYETSKACAELIARSFAITYGMCVFTPRFVNIYGPGDLNFGRLVPKIIKKIIDDKHPTIWNKRIVRDFLYIDDAIRAYMQLAQTNLPKKNGAHVHNFGSGKAQSIYKIAEKLVRVSRKSEIKVVSGSMPKGRGGEILRQYVSVAKAKRELGWEPKVSLNEGLKKTYSWYRNYLSVE